MATYLSGTENVSLKKISGLLRHKNLKTTEIYLHTVDESQRLVMSQIEGKFTPKNKNHLTKKGITKTQKPLNPNPTSLPTTLARCHGYLRYPPPMA
jgi:hypothetical protein